MSYGNSNYGNGGNNGNGRNGGGGGGNGGGARYDNDQSWRDGDRDRGEKTQKVYIVACLADRQRAALVADELQRSGLEVTSDWIKRPETEVPTHPAERLGMLTDTRKRLRYADFLVVLSNDHSSDLHWIAQVGDYLSLGRPIVWSEEKGGMFLYTAADEVISVARDSDIFMGMTQARKLVAFKRKGYWEGTRSAGDRG